MQNASRPRPRVLHRGLVAGSGSSAGDDDGVFDVEAAGKGTTTTACSA